jgi:hypothetical protein
MSEEAGSGLTPFLEAKAGRVVRAAPSDTCPDGILPPGVLPADIHFEVERICAHPLFAKAKSLQDFLRFTVAETLEGRGRQLKEYSIALSALHRTDNFDPRNASIVRTQAGNLRLRLRDYYARTNYASRVYFVYKPGCYAPSFHEAPPEESPLTGRIDLDPAGDEFSIAIRPLVVSQEEPWLRSMSEYFEDCLCCELVSTPGMRVMAADHAPSPVRPGQDFGLKKYRYRLEGSVFEGASVHLSLRLVSADDGSTCWAATGSVSRDDLEAHAPRIAALMAEGIADELESVVLSARQRLRAITSKPTQSVRRRGLRSIAGE